jgi:GAF domain-containing protein
VLRNPAVVKGWGWLWSGMAVSEREVTLADVFVTLADSLRPERDVIDTMDVLVQAATVFTAADDAGIVLADAGGALHVLASTSERAADVEEEQLGVRQGPCLHSYRTASMVDVPDIRDVTDRWPDFARTALALGFRAAHATPMTLRGQTVGAINVFLQHEGSMTERDVALLDAFAHAATIGLLHSRSLNAQTVLSEQLQHALDSRIVIEQAKGAIAERYQIGIDAAFARIRAHSRRASAPLRVIAEQIVAQTITV